MQRLVMSSGEAIIWGEPLGDAAILPRLTYSLGYLTKKWPPQTFFPTTYDVKILVNCWIANLTPEISYLCSAHRTFFCEWLQTPAVEKFGIERWGFKEVRLTIEHAKYLKILFPKAKFIFIYRNPHNAYRSWRGNKWESMWPGYCPYSAFIYARHWKLLLSGFMTAYKEVDGILIKFEDLVSGRYDLNKIAAHLNVSKIDNTVLKEKIGTPSSIVHKKKHLPIIEKQIISFVAGRLMKEAGYL